MRSTKAQVVVGEVQVRLARPDERRRWDGLMDRHHYLGFRQFAGRGLRHVAVWCGYWLALVGGIRPPQRRLYRPARRVTGHRADLNVPATPVPARSDASSSARIVTASPGHHAVGYDGGQVLAVLPMSSNRPATPKQAVRTNLAPPSRNSLAEVPIPLYHRPQYLNEMSTKRPCRGRAGVAQAPRGMMLLPSWFTANA